MHCPQCGVRIESDEISYCTRCGQTLERIRLAMSDERLVARETQISRAGLNLGVGLMYAGLWPALLAVILSPTALPVAFLMLTAALLAVIFGSGTLLRLFQTEELHPEILRSRRKEIAFGATLMYLGAIMVTLIVAVGVPDSWVKVLLIGKITAAFGALLIFSKPLYSAYRSLASNDPMMLKPASGGREVTTAPLDDAPLLQMPKREQDMPWSVSDETTRSLDEVDRGR